MAWLSGSFALFLLLAVVSQVLGQEKGRKKTSFLFDWAMWQSCLGMVLVAILAHCL